MWAAQIKEAPEPPLPDALSDRQQDGAEPLLVLADTVGGDWSHQGRQSLIEIFGGRSAEDQSHGVRLLSDVRDIFEVCGVGEYRDQRAYREAGGDRDFTLV